MEFSTEAEAQISAVDAPVVQLRKKKIPPFFSHLEQQSLILG